MGDIMKCYYCKNIIEKNNSIFYPITEKTNKYFHKNEECYNKYLFEKQNKCYFCKKKIVFESDYILKDSRYFHKNCYEDYKIKEKENNDWNELYYYVKEKILKYPKEISLSKTQIFSLKELREGRLLVNGSKQEYQGYTYQDIYITFVLNEHIILNSLQGKNFKNENQKFKYIIAIIRDKINDVVIKRLEIKEQSNKIKNIKFNEKVSNIYIKKTNFNNKLLDLLNDRW